uniref:Uncharacterized protein n=1 Tax=Rhizophora mucronata TaxID=61149 RepID=A0A2P2P8W2_RHIMU
MVNRSTNQKKEESSLHMNKSGSFARVHVLLQTKHIAN